MDLMDLMDLMDPMDPSRGSETACPSGPRDEYHGVMRSSGMDPTVLLVARRHVDFGRLASALCPGGV